MKLVPTLLLLVVLPALAGCRASAKPIGVPLKERTQFESEWNRYVHFEPQKALAVAGDPAGKYAMGYAFGKATRDEAVREALDACALRRSDRRIEAVCRLYAVGNEIESAP